MLKIQIPNYSFCMPNPGIIPSLAMNVDPKTMFYIKQVQHEKVRVE